MRKRSLGKTGIMVSELAFGGVEIGLPYGVHKELMPQNAAIDLLKAAVDSGINFFDTARRYGCSEERMGMAFKGMRNKVVLSSKCSLLRLADGKIRTAAALRTFVEECLRTSLKTLGTDYLDVYLVHGADTEILKTDEVADIFEAIKRKGYVRSIGVSTYGLADFKLACEDGRWDVVQLAFNLMDQSCGVLFPMTKQKGVGIMVRSVLMRGILTDAKFEYHENIKCVETHKKKYFDMLSPQIPAISDLAVKFVLSFDEVSSVLVGIDKRQFLDNAVSVADGRYLDSKQLAHAQSLAYPEPEFLNLATWDKNGWLK